LGIGFVARAQIAWKETHHRKIPSLLSQSVSEGYGAKSPSFRYPQDSVDESPLIHLQPRFVALISQAHANRTWAEGLRVRHVAA